MKILLSEIIQEVSERVWDNQTTENFWVNNKTGLEKSERRVSEDISNYKIIRHNYFAYNPYRVNVWSIGLFDWDLWAVSPAYVVFKVDENKIIPLLLINFLKSQRWLIEINQHTHGWVRKSLSIWDLWKIEIDIPDIEKQKEFIDMSDKHWAIVEKIWNINIDNQVLVKRLRQSILQDAIQGKLVPQDPNDEPASELLKKIKAEKDQLTKEKKIKKGKDLSPITDNEKPFDLPNGWEWCRLGEVSNYWSCQKLEPKNAKKWLRILDLEDIEKDSSKVLKKIYYPEREFSSTKSLFSKWQLLYSKLRPYLNKVIVADEDWVCTTEILPIKLYWEIDQHFIKIVLKSNYFLDYVNKITYWIKMPRLWTEDWQIALIPFPPLAEQHRIVAKVDELMKFCDWLEKEISEAKENGEKLMESVLGEVFR